jgi:hypothetical protein
VCPGVSQSTPTTISAGWLAGPLTLSADGQHMKDSRTLTDPLGNTQTYEWDLTAQRE